MRIFGIENKNKTKTYFLCVRNPSSIFWGINLIVWTLLPILAGVLSLVDSVVLNNNWVFMWKVLLLLFYIKHIFYIETEIEVE